VKHLAPPERVSSGAVVYVVWARALDGAGTPQNIGALKLSDDLRGTLHAVTPLRAFDLVVTAEASSTAAAPTSPAILSARISGKR
jgi:hypothetical protein